MTFVVMGVSGSGKTTEEGVARSFRWILLEGDSFHPAANIIKMKAGIRLTDADRLPRLQAVDAREDELRVRSQSSAVACSAPKRTYRDILVRNRADALLMFLRGSKALIAERMRLRKGHFMPPALLDSQFATVEEPEPDEHPIGDNAGPMEAVIRPATNKLKERLS
jgi:gluconokinase